MKLSAVKPPVGWFFICCAMSLFDLTFCFSILCDVVNCFFPVASDHDLSVETEIEWEQEVPLSRVALRVDVCVSAGF